MAITDYHKLIRDGIVAAINAAAPGCSAVGVDDLDDVEKITSLPAITVACVGPEQARPEMGTNERDGIGYPVAVVLLSLGAGNGSQSPEAPELTAFRRQVRTLFHNKRLSAVTEVGWCEVTDSGPLFDPKDPMFQRVSTAMVVTAVGRFPRS